MAMWPLNGVVQLLIILSLANFLDAQIRYHPAAQVSTSWTNNNLSIPSISISNRIILLNKIGFACGFYSDYHGAYFAVGFAKTWTDQNWTPGKGYWYFSNVIWVANRNKPIGENATVQLLPEGNLVLSDADGTAVWSSKTSNMSVVGMKMMETGNLVLYDANNKTVWQSFDYPQDVLLHGQKLVVGQKLVAGISKANRSEGSFYLSVTPEGVFAFYQANAPQMYFQYLWQDLLWQRQTFQVESIQLIYSEDANGTSSLGLYLLSSLSSEPEIWINISVEHSRTSYIKFDPDGHIRLYDDNTDEPVDVLADSMKECDYPTSCGNYGLCSNGQCSCPPGFARDNASIAQGRYGCSEINPVQATCENPQYQSFLTLEDVYYFNYIDPGAAILRDTDVDSCKEACLKNCSCKAALFQHSYGALKLQGSCFLPSPVLSLIYDGKERFNYKSYAFLKISNRGKDGRGPIIAGSTIGSFFLVSMIVGIGYVLLRKKRHGKEGMEDYLDQFPGMSKRFTYEELKAATGDFQKKLGKGGFGSVFAGNLENGEKIAVKRLEALGQGMKEFLAEVRTVGSIHHVDLVRLIGFCAEKLHRLLVYEFMCNGSLDNWILCREPLQPPLDWQTRRTIILDIAKGLAYLHEDCRERIVHLDVKPQNILLDAYLHAKLSDFGLSRSIDRDQSQVVTTMRGTPGYLAPELLSSIITVKADVYSFGIVVMEIVCGRKNLDRSQPGECLHLLPVFMKKAQEDQLVDMVDKCSEDMQLHKLQAVEMMRVAIWCLQSDFTRRPSMSMVVKVIEGTMGVEADLDYSIQNPTTMAARRREVVFGTASTIMPSVLSGPR